jgi:hypothetical protein
MVGLVGRMWPGVGDPREQDPAIWMAATRMGASLSDPVGALRRGIKPQKCLWRGWGGGPEKEPTFPSGYTSRSAVWDRPCRRTTCGSGELKRTRCLWQGAGAGPKLAVGTVAEELQRLTETIPRLWQGEHPQRGRCAGG